MQWMLSFIKPNKKRPGGLPDLTWAALSTSASTSVVTRKQRPI